MLREIQVKESLNNRERVVDLIEEVLKEFDPVDLNRELVFVIGVNPRLIPVYCDLLTIGTLNYAVVVPRDVFRRALIEGVFGIFFVHTHPSGSARPSFDDMETASKLSAGGKLLGVEFLDSFIYPIQQSKKLQIRA